MKPQFGLRDFLSRENLSSERWRRGKIQGAHRKFSRRVLEIYASGKFSMSNAEVHPLSAVWRLGAIVELVQHIVRNDEARVRLPVAPPKLLLLVPAGGRWNTGLKARRMNNTPSPSNQYSALLCIQNQKFWCFF